MNAPVMDIAPHWSWDVVHDWLLRMAAILTIPSDIVVVGSPRCCETKQINGNGRTWQFIVNAPIHCSVIPHAHTCSWVTHC